MAHESLEHLQTILKETEEKCNKCIYKWSHVFYNRPTEGCMNFTTKQAVKNVIARRLERIAQYDKSNTA